MLVSRREKHANCTAHIESIRAQSSRRGGDKRVELLCFERLIRRRVASLSTRDINSGSKSPDDHVGAIVHFYYTAELTANLTEY